MLTLGDAAAAAKVSRSTLLRAIRAGKVSATRDEAGAFSIDPAELARVYSLKPIELDAPAPEPTARHGAEVAGHGGEVARLLEKVQGLEALLSEVRQSRDAWQSQAQRLVLPAPAPQAEPVRRRWWRWG